MAAPNNKTFRKKIRKGRPAGSRQNTETKKASQTHIANKDPRHGSKKKVPLTVVTKETTKPAKKFKTPLEELNFIEADERLQQLLDLDSDGQVVADDDKAYMEERLARHQVLCELLGISDDEDDEFDE